jgi:hypothetical protein
MIKVFTFYPLLRRILAAETGMLYFFRRVFNGDHKYREREFGGVQAVYRRNACFG